jgi:carbonic anhydrase/acetyltransferase-like protein (isoleucine patch superfamily)
VAGDVNRIQVGSETNIQDNTLVHVAKTNVSGHESPTIIGNKVTVGKCSSTMLDMVGSVY